MAEVKVGDVIAGRYAIDGHLGAGGYGAVFAGSDRRGGARVAIKVLHQHHLGSDVALKRFRREAALVARLDHPNVVRALDHGHSEAGAPYIVFELCEGESLKERLEREGALTVRRVGLVGVQVLRALEHAHAQGIVHRDIKPANIFLTAGPGDDFVRVLDFGIAKMSAPDEDLVTKLTLTGHLLGTPRYMAPEQVRGSGVGPPADLYSLGLVLAELVSGRTVVSASSAIEALMAQVSPEPTPLGEAVLESPLHHVIRRAVEKDAAARFQSASEMRAALEAALANAHPGAAALANAHPGAAARADPARASKRARRQRRLLYAAGGAVLLGAGALAFLLLRGASSDREPAVRTAAARAPRVDPARLPSEWRHLPAQTVRLTSPAELGAFETSLGAKLASVDNHHFSRGDDPLQLNVVVPIAPADARRVYDGLAARLGGRNLLVLLDDAVVEFIGPPHLDGALVEALLAQGLAPRALSR